MRRWAFACVVVAGAASFVAARASDVPDAATVERRLRDASGPRPATERLVVAFDAYGLHGTRTTVRREDDVRETVVDGPFETASGRYRDQGWHQNENGETVLEQSEPDSAEAESASATVTAIASPVAGYALRRLNARGYGEIRYVDAATWRVVRRDVVGPRETTTYAYDDFHTTSGYTRPWHWTVRDGHSENDAEYRVVRDDVGPVTDADVAIPPTRRDLVRFPAGKNSVELPVRFDEDKFIVHVRVGSRGLDFALDTGADGITIDSDVAQQLGLEAHGTMSNAVNAGRFTSSRVIVPEMDVGDLTMRDVVADTVPHFAGGRERIYRTVGLLGFDFIAALVLRMDYEHGTVTAIAPETFAPPSDPLTNALTVRLGTDQPLTDVTVNGALGERFAIDTGASGGVMLFDSFARRHPEVTSGKDAVGLGVQTFNGAGGMFETRRYQLGSVRIGKVNFTGFQANVVDSKGAYDDGTDGLIGTDFLRLYTLYTDYVDSTLYLVPNELGRAGIVR